MSALHTVDTVVIGAGHAGLAVSRLLTEASREHVVLDRGRVGERWRSARWDSLHLLTPSWMNRFPGWLSTDDPDAFLSSGDFVNLLENYAVSFDAPVLTGSTVTSLTTAPTSGYDVRTDHGTWRARSVVVATGPHGRPLLPAAVGRTGVPVITSNRYRNPRHLDAGGVLVVGASASGVQIAYELARSGRDVVLAVGRRTRLTGRLESLDGRTARFGDQLAAVTADADRVMQGLLDSIDSYVDRVGLTREVLAPVRPKAVTVGDAPSRLDLRAERIGTVVVATGYRPDNDWVELPITQTDGTFRQSRGVTGEDSG